MDVNLHDVGGSHSLTFDTGGLAVDAVVVAAGHEPNGYFWEGLVRFAWPEVAERLGFDSEAGMFCATGSAGDLARLRTAVESVLMDSEKVLEIIARGESSGFEFDD
ncbi:Imm51 family immunity protein [Streptomyces sp. NPDC055607]